MVARCNYMYLFYNPNNKRAIITGSDDAVFCDPHTCRKRQEVTLDGSHLALISSIHNTDAGVMTNPGKLVPWGRETNTMHPSTCKNIPSCQRTIEEPSLGQH